MNFIDGLTRTLDVAAKRQQIIASNLANIDTPNYKAADIDFRSALQNALGGQGANVADSGSPVSGLTERPDGNNVSLERETLAMSDTESRYRIAAQLLRSQFHMLSLAIQGDR